MGNALRTELDLALQISGHAGVIRRGPVPDSGHARRASATGLGRLLCGGAGRRVGLRILTRIKVRARRTVGALVLGGNLSAGLLLFLRRSLSLAIRFAVEIDDRPLGIFGQAILRIAVQKLLKNSAGLLGIVEIVFVDLAYGEQGVAPISAARILPPQELVLSNSLVQDFVVVEPAAHLDQRLRNRNHAGIGLDRRRRPVIAAAVSVDDPLIVMPRALAWRTSVERFPHALRTGKAVARPGVAMMRAGMD